ncbi:MAG: homoserine dehydrogenase, partial [Rickettsiales bacterium]|nr:homoserine dehydrogenase [Rickettsiales bacterium]
RFVVRKIAVHDTTKDRGFCVPAGILTTDWNDLVNDPEIDVIVELIGGVAEASRLVRAALTAKKMVITGNKALLAEEGHELVALAEKEDVPLYFEAAVAGGIPIIKVVREALVGNHIQSIYGIINGTSNYILTRMADAELDYAVALKEAQDLGYAEANPTFDVDGVDSAHKLAILTALAYGVPPDTEHMYVEGIRNITLNDIAYAAEMGYRIRLLGISEVSDNRITQRVHPCLLTDRSPIANIDGVLNAVMVECDELGPLLMEGAGAGATPTASAVISDIVECARGIPIPAFTSSTRMLDTEPFSSMEEHQGAYYIRLNVKDNPGVLSAVTSALSKETIGLDSVLQKGHKQSDSAQVALTTFPATEKTVKKALRSIAAMEYVLEPPHVIRIEEV